MLESGGWEVTETWQAKFDDEVTDPLDFLGDPMLPGVGTPHPLNSLLYLKNVPNGVPPKGSVLRTLNFTLVWSTLTLSSDKHDPSRFDDSLRATKSWSHRVIQEPVEKAYVSDDEGVTWSDDPGPIENTVHDLIIPGISGNRYMPTCRYSRNELVVPAAVLDLPGYVNNDTFTLDGISVAPNTAMIIAAPVSSWKRSEMYEFRTVDYEILIKEDGWDEKILNRGFYSYQIGTHLDEHPVKKICKVKNGLADPEDSESNEFPYKNVEEPVSLNVQGIDRHQHESYFDAHPELYPLVFEPHYRWFRHLTYTSFAALGFT